MPSSSLLNLSSKRHNMGAPHGGAYPITRVKAVLLVFVHLAMAASILMGLRYTSLKQHTSRYTHDCLAQEDRAWLDEVARSNTYIYMEHKDFLSMVRRSSGPSGSGCPQQHPVSLHRILFVAMCSRDKQERLKWMQESWMPWVPASNVVLLAEAQIPGYNITVLPALPATDSYVEARYPNATGYQAANLRHLKSIIWLGQTATGALQDIDWVFLVDDDTYVNVPVLLSFLEPFPPSLPVMFANIFDYHSYVYKGYDFGSLTFPLGGGGMLFSKVGFMQLASVLFTGRCELHHEISQNDMIIGNCTAPAGVLKVHNNNFCFEGTWPQRAKFHIRDYIAIHYCQQEGEALAFACLTAAKFGWPHKLCNNGVPVSDGAGHDPAAGKQAAM